MYAATKDIEDSALNENESTTAAKDALKDLSSFDEDEEDEDEDEDEDDDKEHVHKWAWTKQGESSAGGVPSQSQAFRPAWMDDPRMVALYNEARDAGTALMDDIQSDKEKKLADGKKRVPPSKEPSKGKWRIE